MSILLLSGGTIVFYLNDRSGASMAVVPPHSRERNIAFGLTATAWPPPHPPPAGRLHAQVPGPDREWRPRPSRAPARLPACLPACLPALPCPALPARGSIILRASDLKQLVEHVVVALVRVAPHHARALQQIGDGGGATHLPRPRTCNVRVRKTKKSAGSTF